MGTPRKKFSKARRDKRAAHWRLSSPVLAACPRCHEPKLPHRTCPNCGYYRDRQVVQFEA